MKKTGEGVQGKVRAEAFGAYPEGLLNSAAAAGIELFKLQRINANTVSFELYESRLEELERLAEKCAVELSITRYRDRSRRVIKRRFLLLPLIAFMALCLLVSSLFIWQIDIYGSYELSRGELLRVLEDSGLYIGRFWPGLKADDVRSRVMLELDEIGWMTVNISGSKAVVLVNERIEKPEIYDESDAADLVASKTGLIRRISILQGEAVVEPGQAVAGGEQLASGTLQSIMGTERRVRARGSVIADTWYEIDSVCPEEMDVKNDNGLVRHHFAIVLGKRRINLYISSGKAIDECDKIIHEYNLGLDGLFALPIRFVHERIVSYDTEPAQGYDSADMSQRLSALLESQAKGQIMQSAFTESFADGLYVLTLRAHCIENIALTQELD